MIMIVISFALVKFYASAILYVLIVMQIKLAVVVDHVVIFCVCVPTPPPTFLRTEQPK